MRGRVWFITPPVDAKFPIPSDSMVRNSPDTQQILVYAAAWKSGPRNVVIFVPHSHPIISSMAEDSNNRSIQSWRILSHSISHFDPASRKQNLSFRIHSVNATHVCTFLLSSSRHFQRTYRKHTTNTSSRFPSFKTKNQQIPACHPVPFMSWRELTQALISECRWPNKLE